jgi:hypothetical protein
VQLAGGDSRSHGAVYDSMPRTTKSLPHALCLSLAPAPGFPPCPGYFEKDGECEPCKDTMSCGDPGVTLEGVALRPGFWRSTPSSLQVLPCRLSGVCVGGSFASNSSDTSGLCRLHHYGPLCEVR